MKIKHIAIALFGIGALSGCTNLDEEVYSQISKDKFFESQELLTAYAGRAYAALQGYGSEQSLWTLNLQVTDECAAPVNCVNDWTKSRYKELQTHIIPSSNKLVRQGWDYCFDAIAACNDVIYQTERSTIEFEGKAKILSEMRVLRAYLYMMAIDGWGNVPFSIDAADDSYPEQKDRAYVFDFIVKEVNDCLPNLDEEPSTANYGRVTQAMANTLLAKMYLNAEEWTGTAMWKEAEDACYAVMSAGNYIIEDKYKTNFEVQNASSRENIFVIPYSTVYTKSDHNDFVIYIMTLAPQHSKTFNIPTTCWDGLVCQPDFFATYDAADTRRSDTWLYGQQYDIDGAAIDGFVLNPIFDENLYSTGKGENDGARLWKWTYQTDGLLSSDQVSMDNDFALFRYADVVLMWVEAKLRQGQGAATLSNADFRKIRTRAGLQPFTAAELTLDNLLLERGHELAWEGWRRQDLIRYGKYLDKWWAKPEVSSSYAKLYPIPSERLSVNPNLQQNDGYTK
ncbi:MAG: RagB/SusD family nutrient uptake outer membrane protein [Tidjanibacter sp.]|nr:RagB/SusD family nutrient uptake outer membrane protein [Tidjanibacter sp.]